MSLWTRKIACARTNLHFNFIHLSPQAEMEDPVDLLEVELEGRHFRSLKSRGREYVSLAL